MSIYSRTLVRVRNKVQYRLQWQVDRMIETPAGFRPQTVWMSLSSGERQLRYRRGYEHITTGEHKYWLNSGEAATGAWKEVSLENGSETHWTTLWNRSASTPAEQAALAQLWLDFENGNADDVIMEGTL